jgi:hypothetical protein
MTHTSIALLSVLSWTSFVNDDFSACLWASKPTALYCVWACSERGVPDLTRSVESTSLSNRSYRE